MGLNEHIQQQSKALRGRETQVLMVLSTAITNRGGETILRT